MHERIPTVMRTVSSLAIIMALATLGTPVVAHASAADQASDGQGGEIFVTARKREERLSDVPAAITAFTSDDLRRGGVVTLDNLAQSTPGLTSQSLGGTYQAPVIRGVAQINQTSVIGNVGVFIDGIYLNNRSGLEFSFLDVQRIEVVKGPQSALYGRNTFSGAINYVTKPAEIGKFSGTISSEIGDYGRREVRGDINVPLGEMFAVRAFGGIGKFDGTIRNTTDGEHLGGWNKRYTYGGQLLFQPNSDVSIRAFYEKTYTNEDQAPFVSQPSTENNCGSLALGPNGVRYTLYCGTYDVPKTVSVNNDPAHGLIGYSEVAYLKSEFDMGFATFSSTLGYFGSTYSQLNDQNGDPAAVTRPLTAGSPLSQQILQQAVGTGSDEYSFDARLQSNGTGPLQWFGGYYYYSSDINDEITVNYALLNDINNYRQAFGRVATTLFEGHAVYGSVSLDVTDRINLGAEGRYTWERADFYDSANRSVHGQSDFNYFTPKFVARFTPADGVNLYASAAKGYKVGGFNVNAPNTPQFTYAPETNWTYEAGVKTALLNGTLFAEANIFYIDWNDIQVQTNIAQTQVVVITNNKGATSKGIEFDITYKPVPNLTLRAGATFIDPKYKKGTIDGELLAACGEITGTLVFEKGCTADAGGNQLPRTSKRQYIASADYTLPNVIGDYGLFARGDFTYTSPKNYFSLATSSQRAIKLVNAQVGLSSDNVELAFWVRNLFDYRYLARATELGSGNVDGGTASGVIGPRLYPGERRTVGVRLTYSFGQ